MTVRQLPVPSFFNPQQVGKVWRVPYEKRAAEGRAWTKQHEILPAAGDKIRVALLIIDAQNTFCIPGFELFVAGRSGRGAIDDNIRLCEFIYRNLSTITKIFVTMDTHTVMQIFHPIFWINEVGEHPDSATEISLEDLLQGRWKVNPAVAENIYKGKDLDLPKYTLHYVKKITEAGKYKLIVWPYHSLLGGIGHALVSAVEEAVFFHNIVRNSQTQFELKGNDPLTENYSVLSPEVLEDERNREIAQKNTSLLDQLLDFNAVIIAGQAKSHCVAWTVDDLLTEIKRRDPKLAKKIYLLEDCTSSVVIPSVIDFTDQGDRAFQRFAEAGIHLVKSTEAIGNFLDFRF